MSIVRFLSPNYIADVKSQLKKRSFTEALFELENLTSYTASFASTFSNGDIHPEAMGELASLTSVCRQFAKLLRSELEGVEVLYADAGGEAA